MERTHNFVKVKCVEDLRSKHLAVFRGMNVVLYDDQFSFIYLQNKELDHKHKLRCLLTKNCEKVAENLLLEHISTQHENYTRSSMKTLFCCNQELQKKKLLLKRCCISLYYYSRKNHSRKDLLYKKLLYNFILPLAHILKS